MEIRVRVLRATGSTSPAARRPWRHQCLPIPLTRSLTTSIRLVSTSLPLVVSLCLVRLIGITAKLIASSLDAASTLIIIRRLRVTATSPVPHAARSRLIILMRIPSAAAAKAGLLWSSIVSGGMVVTWSHGAALGATHVPLRSSVVGGGTSLVGVGRCNVVVATSAMGGIKVVGAREAAGRSGCIALRTACVVVMLMLSAPLSLILRKVRRIWILVRKEGLALCRITSRALVRKNWRESSETARLLC